MVEKRKTGFASMDPQKQKEISSLGGVAAHRLSVSHRYTSEEARIAGAKDGKAKRDNHAKRAAK